LRSGSAIRSFVPIVSAASIDTSLILNRFTDRIPFSATDMAIV
jgi:hypothetical protein